MVYLMGLGLFGSMCRSLFKQMYKRKKRKEKKIPNGKSKLKKLVHKLYTQDHESTGCRPDLALVSFFSGPTHPPTHFIVALIYIESVKGYVLNTVLLSRPTDM